MSNAFFILKRYALVGFIAIAGFGVLSLPAHAQIDVGSGLNEVNATAQFGEADLETTIGNIIAVVLGFLGIIFLIIIIYAGFLWMLAGGNADQVVKARKWMVNGVIGLIIVLAAYAIANFVIGELATAGLAEGGGRDGGAIVI